MKKINSKIRIWFFLAVIIPVSALGLVIIQGKIIKVSATVDPIAFMGPNADFGIVFPGEIRDKEFFVKAQDDYTASLSYSLVARVKPRAAEDGDYCLNNPADYAKCYPLLCGYLKIVSAENEGDAADNASLAPPADKMDLWKVVLDTPPIKGAVGQDFNGKPVDAADTYGCDIKLVLRESPNGGDDPPVVKAKWEMDSEKDANGKYLGKDDSSAPGAQFLPSGQYNISKNIAVCAIAADPEGAADINAVYADIFYPKNISTGPGHDSEHLGCGRSMGEFSLARLSKEDGYDLFCNKIKSGNNNLPAFNEGYDYNEICEPNGELMKDTANVFCGEKPLSYEDPSGGYDTLVLAQDKSGLSGKLENKFTYLPLTAFETDFSAINYGTVMEKVDQKTDGNLIWGDSIPTVRNVGNTRLGLSIIQDDMGLGKTGGISNVHYDARVGNNAADWAHYDPFALMPLMKQLNLSEMNKMDFSILVDKFELPMKDSYTGTMTLSATQIAHLPCE